MVSQRRHVYPLLRHYARCHDADAAFADAAATLSQPLCAFAIFEIAAAFSLYAADAAEHMLPGADAIDY